MTFERLQQQAERQREREERQREEDILNRQRDHPETFESPEKRVVIYDPTISPADRLLF